MTDQPDPTRQPAYDAVFAYIRSQPRDFMPRTVVERNAMIWHTVNAALDTMTAPATALAQWCGDACSEGHTYAASCALCCAPIDGGTADQSWSVRCPQCAAQPGQPCRRPDGTARAVSDGRRWNLWEHVQAAKEDAARTTPDTPAASSDPAFCGSTTWHPAHRFMRGGQVHQCPGAQAQACSEETTRHVGASSVGEPATAGRATVTVAVTAPDQDNADRWATTIRDLVTAEHGHHMRLDITIGDGQRYEQGSDDGLREQYATALHAAHREWMRPGSDAGQHLMMDILANAVMAVRDRRIEQLAAERDAAHRALDPEDVGLVDEMLGTVANRDARIAKLEQQLVAQTATANKLAHTEQPTNPKDPE